MIADQARFDAANAEDPNTELVEGQSVAKEVRYAQRMSAWLQQLVPDASEVLQLAARAQPIWKAICSILPLSRMRTNGSRSYSGPGSGLGTKCRHRVMTPLCNWISPLKCAGYSTGRYLLPKSGLSLA